MKRRLMMTAAMLAVLGGISTAHANNRSVEVALANYSDVSVFYAALLNTGVLNELDPNTHYTVFAPTNQAFAQIQPDVYPCFYATQCRAQVADVLRNHISAGGKTLNELVHYPDVPTLGRYAVFAEEPYVGNFEIGHHTVLSAAEIHGNDIYRIDGVIVSDDQLAQLRALPPVADAVVKERTIVTYRAPAGYPIPGGNYPASGTQTVVEKTYVTPEAEPAAVIYPAETVTTGRVYVAPGDNQTTTTVTRTITTNP